MAQQPFKVTRKLETLPKARYIALWEDDLDGIEGYIFGIENDPNHRKWFIIPKRDVEEVTSMYCPRQDTSWFVGESMTNILVKDVNELEYEIISDFSENGVALPPGI